jgi:drug/metabolite transporter (DMT)-like permease
MPPTLAGVALAMTALLLFVVMDTLIKWLTGHLPVMQIVWARFAFHLVFVAAAIGATSGLRLFRARALRLQTLRSLCLVGCSILFTAGLALIPLADATAVGFASPLFTVALAALWLGERVSARRWAGVAVGMLGVVVVTRPPFLTGEPVSPALLLPLASAGLLGVYHILTRRLATLDDPRTTILHTSLAAFAVTSLAQPFVWEPPAALDWVLFATLGALGAGSHYLLVLAYARAPASLLSPLSYAQLFWAVLASWLVFSDAPDGWTLAGVAVIAAGGLLVAWPERRRAG